MKTKPTTNLADNKVMETNIEPDWDNSKPRKGWGQGITHSKRSNPFANFNPATGGFTNANPNTSTTSNPNNLILNQILKKLEQLNNINTQLSRLKGTKPQAKPAHTSQPAATPRPKPTQNTSNPTNVSWANVAAKANTKAPEVKASNIAAAIKRDILKPSPTQSNNRNFVVCFKTLPVTQPNPKSIFVSMQECLDAANRTLSKGRLTQVRWTLKASLHLSFSNSASITAIKNTIPLLMDKLKMPEYKFGPKVPWSCLVVTNVPTGMGGPAQRMRNRDKLTQLLRDLFPKEAKFGNLKITLAPDWLADPAHLQAEGCQASTVSFAFEDTGGITSSRLLTNPQLFIYGQQCKIKKFNPKPLLQKPQCHKCGRNNHLTKEHNADNCPQSIQDSKGNPCKCDTACHAAYTVTNLTPPSAPRCWSSAALSRKSLQAGQQVLMPEHHILQLNVAGCNPRMHALLNKPLYEYFDIFILQDIWWGRIGSQKDTNPNKQNIYGTVASTNFLCIIPPGFNSVKGPGVAIYIRNNHNIHPQFSNISPIHKDILAVDLKLHNSLVTIINCYPHGKSLKDTVDAITNINIPMDRPCIMARDFNLHHPKWALAGSKWEQHRPNAQERMFKAYTEYQDLHVLNHLSLPTHIVPKSPTSNAIIDLTLLNSQAVDAWPNLNWEVEAQSSSKSLGSDHMAITWTIGPHNQAKSVGVMEPSPRHLIDTSRQKKWTQEYMRQVQKNPPLQIPW
ncbi:hypothetical protein RhiXN_08139 [Rhizoctonia solani]|uniref:Endonuclease/exonuclease/phosphatase domain-containing protein n=1 Tax=Rhizoctonia solani TaxID=456999 RepID=A0A8H8P209_9AGAM|nr:uncharacterized protein RhiXN_08139 [Rhizoctonia solani]QRW23103.1 hypothetical protein RhiXN_08139 [Rhizoctonia solani]